MNKIIRRFVSFVLVASPLVACSLGPDDAQIDKDTAATESALNGSLAKTPPPPPTTDGKVVSGGDTSKGIFCILCEAQGCICSGAGDACIECGYHLTATPPREP